MTYQDSKYGKHFLDWTVKKWNVENPMTKIKSAKFYCSTKDILTVNGTKGEIVIANY